MRSQRSESVGSGGASSPRKAAAISWKIHGLVMAARPIMRPETAARCQRCTAAAAESISPLPITGMRTASATEAMTSQSACPEYPWARVRPCTVRRQIPASSRRRALSGALTDCSSQPVRIFAVTGSGETARTTAEAMAARRVPSRRREDPPFLQTTLLTGQPKLRSMKSGCFQSTTEVAPRASCSGSPPKSWTPRGCSSGVKSTNCSVRSLRCRMPSAETNSVVSTSAPRALQMRRKTELVTPAMGARKRTGRSARGVKPGCAVACSMGMGRCRGRRRLLGQAASPSWSPRRAVTSACTSGTWARLRRGLGMRKVSPVPARS